MSIVNDAQRTILLVSPYWRERHRWMASSVKLSELWQRIGYRVVVLCMGEKTETRIVSPTLTVYTVRDFFLPDPWNYGIALGFSRRVLALAREIKPDIIVINKILFWTSLSIFKLRKAGYNVLLLTDALVGITWWPRGLVAKIGAFLYAHTLGRMIVRRADRIVFFHPQPEHVLRSLDIAQKSQVIPTGIDAEKFMPPPERTSGNVTVTYVGRLESVKGVDDLLGVMHDIVNKQPQVHLQIVGWYAPGHELVRAYVHPSIRFLGLREDVAKILQSTDIFVLPSYSEGLSNALMEAMASGIACIATDVGGNAFLLDHGKNGVLYPPGDRVELAKEISLLAADPVRRRELGRLARARIEQVFDWHVVERQYAELFQSFIR